MRFLLIWHSKYSAKKYTPTDCFIGYFAHWGTLYYYTSTCHLARLVIAYVAVVRASYSSLLSDLSKKSRWSFGV